MAGVHTAAANGFAKGAAAYAAGRPDYPPALRPWLTSVLGLGPGKNAVDLGAGTGKFTPALLASGAAVLAIEPVPEMREQFKHTVPDVAIHDGAADAMPFADGSADAVVCAQAFHWFATPAALAEIRRVLRPGGALGLVWNVRDDSVAWVAALSQVMTPYEGAAPRFYSGDWRRVFPAPGFTALGEHQFAHSHTGPAQRVILERTMSISFIAALPDAERDKVAAQVRELIRRFGLDGPGEATFPYKTLAYDCRTI